MPYKIYYDAFQEAKWFQSLNPDFSDAELFPINNANDPEVSRLLRYDKPDIILLRNNKAILALEKTTEVPTGHNVGQRFARIVCSAEEGIPFVYFFPFLALKHGEYASACWVNARLLEALNNLRDIHSTPIIAVDWKCDDHYELVRDGSQDIFLKEIINDLISDNNIAIKRAYEIMGTKYREALKRHPQYSSLPPTAEEISTEEYLNKIEKKLGKNKISKTFSKRKKSLVYNIGMKYVRSDPYTGTQLIYDYLLARTGITPKERTLNLVLYMPNISREIWDMAAKKKDRKDIKLYTKFADMIELADDIIMP
jgi:hypothetical protein